jgi:hypothetical protein
VLLILLACYSILVDVVVVSQKLGSAALEKWVIRLTFSHIVGKWISCIRSRMIHGIDVKGVSTAGFIVFNG